MVWCQELYTHNTSRIDNQNLFSHRMTNNVRYKVRGQNFRWSEGCVFLHSVVYIWNTCWKLFAKLQHYILILCPDPWCQACQLTWSRLYCLHSRNYGLGSLSVSVHQRFLKYYFFPEYGAVDFCTLVQMKITVSISLWSCAHFDLQVFSEIFCKVPHHKHWTSC